MDFHGFFIFPAWTIQGRNVFFFMVLPYCVYVLYSKKDGLLYHGFTTHLKNRLIDHNRGKTKNTSKRRPLQLIFCEFFLHKSDAQRREKYFKTAQGKRMLKLILRKTYAQVNYKRETIISIP